MSDINMTKLGANEKIGVMITAKDIDLCSYLIIQSQPCLVYPIPMSDTHDISTRPKFINKTLGELRMKDDDRAGLISDAVDLASEYLSKEHPTGLAYVSFISALAVPTMPGQPSDGRYTIYLQHAIQDLI